MPLDLPGLLISGLFALYGLWLLALSILFWGIRSDTHETRRAVDALKTDLITAMRTEIALAFALHGPAALQYNIDRVQAQQDAYLGSTRSDGKPYSEGAG